MTQIPTLKPKKLIRIISKLGFKKIRQVGSHMFFRHPDGRSTVVPNHPGKDIGRGLLRAIMTDIKITSKELLQLL